MSDVTVLITLVTRMCRVRDIRYKLLKDRNSNDMKFGDRDGHRIDQSQSNEMPLSLSTSPNLTK
jgi:hypothetical protein